MIDFFPEYEKKLSGIQMLLRNEILNKKFLECFEIHKPFVPGELASVMFSILNVNHTFRKRYRLVVQVQSG